MAVTGDQETWKRERQMADFTDMYATVFGSCRHAGDRDPIRTDKKATAFRLARLSALSV